MGNYDGLRSGIQSGIRESYVGAAMGDIMEGYEAEDSGR